MTKRIINQKTKFVQSTYANELGGITIAELITARHTMGGHTKVVRCLQCLALYCNLAHAHNEQMNYEEPL